MKFTYDKHKWLVQGIFLLLAAGALSLCPLLLDAESINSARLTSLFIIGGLAAAFLIWFAVVSCIYYKKEIYLSPEGCTISFTLAFISIKKFYPWSHYRTIRFQKTKYTVTRFGNGTGRFALVFDPESHTRHSKEPLARCLGRAPFQSFCLFIFPEKEPQPTAFTANRQTIETLQTWGVRIQDLPKGEDAKDFERYLKSYD